MAVGKVSINTSIKDVSEGRKFKHLLRFAISEPTDFNSSITSRGPASCLKYKRVSLTEPLKNEYLGVCSIDDYMTLPASSGGTGAVDEVFRSSSFYAEYTDYNTSLSDQKRLEIQVWEFYNNLNAYTIAESGVESNRTYTFPDYTNELLNGLISRHRLLLYKNQAASDTTKTIENIIIPMLSANYGLYESLKDAADLLLTNAQGHKNNLVNMVNLKSGINLLQDNLKRFSQSLQFSDEKMSRVAGKAESLNVVVDGITMDDDDKVLVKNYIASITIESKVADPIEAPNTDATATIASSVMPGISFIKGVEADYFTDLTTIDALMVLIEQFGQSLDSEITTKNSEVSSLNDDIETRKSEIQDIESRLRSIRPSIDLSNPESAWYLTVNVAGGS